MYRKHLQQYTPEGRNYFSKMKSESSITNFETRKLDILRESCSNSEFTKYYISNIEGDIPADKEEC